MHDLNTINRLNAEAHAKAIAQWRAAGKYVTAYYAGLSLIEAVPHDTEAAAIAKSESYTIGASERVEILQPTGTHHAATRDQSEDRRQPYTLEQLAALGNSSVANPAQVPA